MTPKSRRRVANTLMPRTGAASCSMARSTAASAIAVVNELQASMGTAVGTGTVPNSQDDHAFGGQEAAPASSSVSERAGCGS